MPVESVHAPGRVAYVDVTATSGRACDLRTLQHTGEGRVTNTRLELVTVHHNIQWHPMWHEITYNKLRKNK